MKQYLDLLRDVRDNGRSKSDRTGTGTRAVFGRQIRFDLSKGFPLLTTKKMFTRGVIEELLWFLRGSSDIKELQDRGVRIWDEWTVPGREFDRNERATMLLQHLRAAGDDVSMGEIQSMSPEAFLADYVSNNLPLHEKTTSIGRGYGAQWRNWRSVSQGKPIPLSTRVEMHLAKNEYAAQELLSLKHAHATHPDGEHGVDKQLYIQACDQGGIPRRFEEMKEVDQIADLIHDLKTNPTSRRHIVTAWNPGELDQMALPPCHCLFQFYCEELTEEERKHLWEEKMGRKFMSEYVPSLYVQRAHWDEAFAANMAADGIPQYRLSCQLYQRSADIFLGVPFNIASYALLTMMVAQCVNMVPGDFVHTFGDLHIYNNHIEQVNEQLSRTPFDLPKMVINPEVKDIFSFKLEDFKLEGYQHHPAIKAEVSV